MKYVVGLAFQKYIIYLCDNFDGYEVHNNIEDQLLTHKHHHANHLRSQCVDKLHHGDTKCWKPVFDYKLSQ